MIIYNCWVENEKLDHIASHEDEVQEVGHIEGPEVEVGVSLELRPPHHHQVSHTTNHTDEQENRNDEPIRTDFNDKLRSHKIGSDELYLTLYSSLSCLGMI